jgi:hypothetical protein
MPPEQETRCQLYSLTECDAWPPPLSLIPQNVADTHLCWKDMMRFGKVVRVFLPYMMPSFWDSSSKLGRWVSLISGPYQSVATPKDLI